MSDKIKGFFFRAKIFVWYLVTEPFRELYGFWYHIGQALNKTIYWVYYLLLLSVIATFVGKKWLTGVLLVLLLGMILTWEWHSGFFMNRYRQKERKRIENTLRETEPNAMKADKEDK